MPFKWPTWNIRVNEAIILIGFLNHQHVKKWQCKSEEFEENDRFNTCVDGWCNASLTNLPCLSVSLSPTLHRMSSWLSYQLESAKAAAPAEDWNSYSKTAYLFIVAITITLPLKFYKHSLLTPYNPSISHYISLILEVVI